MSRDPTVRAAAYFRVYSRHAAAAWIAVGLLLLTGCAAMPAPAPRTASQAMAVVGDTPLARLAADATPQGLEHLSGFALIADGSDALATRLALVQRARKSLDVQVYLIGSDAAGMQFLQALHQAAERGVRVRLLVDDLHAGAQGNLFTALAAHPHFEVRLFNPLPVRSGSTSQRFLLSLHEFARINRRMHNKLFIADNSLAVAGGRNVGDEYFMRNSVANFIDLDVLASGPVVRDLSASFDSYWNDPLAFPVESLATASSAAAFESLRAAVPTPETLSAAWGDAVASQIEGGRLQLHFAAARVLADSPAKAAATDRPDEPGKAMEDALALMVAAEREVLIASPYFVPGPKGIELMRQARARGIQVAVTTNSFGATDEPLAHWGYARYREEMLAMGVDLRELNPTRRSETSLLGQLRSSLARLHAKLAVVDRRWLLVGSMNMDLRSSRLNTELSLAIDSVVLAGEASELVRHRWHDGNYRLQLHAPDGRIEWVAGEDDRIVIHRSEPDADWLQRMRLNLMSAFVSERHL